MNENDVTTTEETIVDAGVEVDTPIDDVEPSSENIETAAESQEQEQEQGPEQQTVDVNAIAAAARRKAEAQLKQRDAEFARRFGHLTNPQTGQPIRSEDEYLAALDAQEEMRAKEQLQEKGIDPTLIDNLIANNPLIRQAQEVMAQNQQAQLINQINADIAELGRLDPSITSLETVPKEVIDYCMANSKREITLVEAYKMLNYGRVSSGQQAAITQQAINQAKGKSHLNPVNGVATPEEGAEIPTSELEMWKDMFPDKSAADLKKLYNRTLK